MRQTILTGLRTNAEYHLGNYIGAILPMVQMAQNHADEYQINLFAPDLHSFTTSIDHTKLHAQTMSNIALFVACGFPIDHEYADIYRQSRIPAHSELTVILNNFAYMGELSRMTQFKEKSDGSDTVTAGLFDYPVLMAADILLYGAQWVPVGEDQRQHLEFTRNLATRFNNKFGDVFVVPESSDKQNTFVDRDAAPRIRSLRDPSKKMSKSVDDPAGTIQLSDSPDVATKKIMSATTDNVGAVHFDWENQPGVTNLLQILSLLSNSPQADVNAQWDGNERYGDLKTATAAVVSERLAQIQSAIQSVDDAALEARLQSSEQKMTVTANETLLKVQKVVGLT